MAEVFKGKVSRILPTPTDAWGHPTLAQVNPNSRDGAITYRIVIPWWLRGRTGALQVGDEVCYAVFDDTTGIILSRADGHWQGVMDFDVTTSGDVVDEKSVTTHGDTNHKANVLTEGTTTVVKQITGQGGMAVSGGDGASVTGSMSITGDVDAGGDVTAGSISLQNHWHQGVHGPTGPAQA